MLIVAALLFVSCPGAADETNVAITDQRLPIPDQKTRASNRAKIESIFDVAKVNGRDEKRKLAKQLLQTAKDTTNDTSVRFVLMNLARQNSEQSGDVDGAMAAINGIVSEYQELSKHLFGNESAV